MSTATLTLLAGPSGCGKTRLAKQRWPNTQPTCPEDIRRLIVDDASTRDAGTEAYSTARSIAETRLQRGWPTVFDATSLQRRDLKWAQAAAARNNATVHLVIVRATFNQCKAGWQQRARSRQQTLPADLDVFLGRQIAATERLIDAINSGRIAHDFDHVEIVDRTHHAAARP